MKKKVVVGLVTVLFMFGIVGVANSTILSTESYNLQNLGGSNGNYWGWGKTNWNLAPFFQINPLTDLAEVDTMLSNGYTYVKGEYANYDKLNGIYSWDGSQEVFLDYTFNQDMQLNSFGLQLSRVNSGATVTAMTYLDGELIGTFENSISYTSWSSSAPPPFLFFDLDGVTADSILLIFEGHQGLHEVQFDGTNPVPEPSTVILLGLGLVGFAGVSRKRLKR